MTTSKTSDDGTTESLSLVHNKLINISPYNVLSSVLIISKKEQVAAKYIDNIGVHIASANASDPTSGEILDPIRNAIYFSISKNKLTYISDASNADSRFLSYFSWLLQNQTNTLSSSFALNLKTAFSSSFENAIKGNSIKKLIVQSSNKNCHQNSFIESGRDSFLNKLLQTPLITPHSDNENYEILKTCNFSMELTLGKSQQRKKANTLYSCCSKLSEDKLSELTIVLNNGKTIKGGELFYNKRATIQCKKGVLIQASALQATSQWLAEELSTL